MKWELDKRTGLMKPTKDTNIYFGMAISGGLRVDDRKNNKTYIIERDGVLKRIFGTLPENSINIYDDRDARMIADRVARLFGRDHKFADFKMFSKAYRKEIVEEGRMGKLIDAAKTDEIRKEDDTDNIKDFKPIYWAERNIYVADRFYTERGKDLFTFDEIEEMEFPDGWRFMTFGEASDMELYTQKCDVNNDSTVSVEIYPLAKPDKEISLRLPIKQGEEDAEFWVGAKGARPTFLNLKGMRLVFGENGPQILNVKMGNKHNVLLVKDAEGVTEGRMGKLIDDAKKDAIRKEDAFSYKAVDLGLPSGRKWCNMNIGAKHMEDSGLYFAWGDTEGFYENEINKPIFSLSWYKSKPCSDLSENIRPDSGYDAARENMGGTWRLPTEEDVEELKSNCLMEWTSIGGVNGLKVISKNDESKYVFFPASGIGSGEEIFYKNEIGYFLTSTNGIRKNEFVMLNTGSEKKEINTCDYAKPLGYSVRAVCD